MNMKTLKKMMELAVIKALKDKGLTLKEIAIVLECSYIKIRKLHTEIKDQDRSLGMISLHSLLDHILYETEEAYYKAHVERDMQEYGMIQEDTKKIKEDMHTSDTLESKVLELYRYNTFETRQRKHELDRIFQTTHTEHNVSENIHENITPTTNVSEIIQKQRTPSRQIPIKTYSREEIERAKRRELMKIQKRMKMKLGNSINTAKMRKLILKELGYL